MLKIVPERSPYSSSASAENLRQEMPLRYIGRWKIKVPLRPLWHDNYQAKVSKAK